MLRGTIAKVSEVYRALNDFYDAWQVAKSLKDGEITINDAPSHGVGFFPFGGTGDSGTGREGIGYSIEEMTRLKTVVFNLVPAKLGKRGRYLPFEGTNFSLDSPIQSFYSTFLAVH
jgi:hypothetical protein